VFADTRLKVLDLSACAGIRVEGQEGVEPMDLALPHEGFAEAAKAFVTHAVVEVLRADVDDVDIIELLPFLGGSAVDKLRFVSPRMGEYEWQRPPRSLLVELTDPEAVSTAAAVTMTAWRPVPAKWRPFLRVIDLSGMTVDLMPTGASFEGFHWLERVVLPARLRVLPSHLFCGCVRLKSIVTSSTALEEIGSNACRGCTSLTEFPFPSTLSKLNAAFIGTSIPIVDLSGTRAESVSILGMVFLAELVLPRRCILGLVRGVPSLRLVSFGRSRTGGDLAWHPTEVRFESLAACADFSPGLLEARVYAEVASELGRETVPFPPP
jgi:hypothetical protein